MPVSDPFFPYALATLADAAAVHSGFHGQPVPAPAWILMAVAYSILLVYNLPEILETAYWRSRAITDSHE